MKNTFYPLSQSPQPLIRPLKTLLLAAVGAVMVSCSTANIAVSDDLAANSSVYKVSGNIVHVNQAIHFGPYHTSNVHRSWTERGTVSVAILKKSQAHQALTFTQFTPDGKRALVVAENIYNRNDFELLKKGGMKKWLENYRNAYTGLITPSEAGKPSWDFVVLNMDDTEESTTVDYGEANSSDGEIIYIKGINKLQKERLPGDSYDTYGFEFEYMGHRIGAVSVRNNGKVWIKDNLPADQQLLVASLASALILRRSVKEAQN